MKLICSGTDSSAVLECRMYLFVYEGFSGGTGRQQETEALVVQAAELYVTEKGLDFGGLSREICRTEKGKPYFKELPLEFSVSHTGDLWVCLMTSGSDPVGVDIQQVKATKSARIADRYFTEDEKKFLDAGGEDAFFTVWTRKEAYAKYTGRGLSKELSDVTTLSNKEVAFIAFDIRAGVKGSGCVKEEGELCLRMI